MKEPEENKQPAQKPVHPNVKAYHDARANALLLEILPKEAPELMPAFLQFLNQQSQHE